MLRCIGYLPNREQRWINSGRLLVRDADRRQQQLPNVCCGAGRESFVSNTLKFVAAVVANSQSHSSGPSRAHTEVPNAQADEKA